MKWPRELDVIAFALQRLDARSHVSPATLEVNCRGGQWVAQIVADPLKRPLVGTGRDWEEALDVLARAVELYDWRRVRR